MGGEKEALLFYQTSFPVISGVEKTEKVDVDHPWSFSPCSAAKSHTIFARSALPPFQRLLNGTQHILHSFGLPFPCQKFRTCEDNNLNSFLEFVQSVVSVLQSLSCHVIMVEESLDDGVC